MEGAYLPGNIRQRMQELGGTADVCGAAAKARRVLDAAGLQRYLTIR